jgi:acyl carrier protein
MNKNNITDTLFSLMSARLEKLGVSAGDIDKTESLLSQGIFDSMGFIEYIAEIEEAFDIEIDFEEMDAADFTSVEQLAKIVASSK